MSKKINKKRFLRTKHRGQLNIIEVVLAASIILVLSVSIAQIGLKIAETSQKNESSILKSTTEMLLRDADELGLLRPFLYQNISNNIEQHLETSVPPGAFYWLHEVGGNCLKNSQIDCDEVDLLEFEFYRSTLLLSGYLTDNSPKIAILTLSNTF